MKRRRVLVAHQSTIPHYRVPFYEAVERARPPWWEFDVAFDVDQKRRSRFFVEPVDDRQFGFGVVPTSTFSMRVFGRLVALQTFVLRGGRYDLIIVEDALHNLSYPLSRFWRFFGTGIGYWGHGRDMSVDRPGRWKLIGEALKLRMSCNCEAYFAYTAGVRDYLASRGVPAEKIFVLNNTIDIKAERAAYEETACLRKQLRQSAGLQDRRVLLFVGRLDQRKRLGFLGETVEILRRRRPDYHLLVVGGGDQGIVESLNNVLGPEGLTYCGVIVERSRLAEIYVQSDLYVFPGDVGLGVVQALCYGLTPAVVARSFHNPEYEYLNERNAAILGGQPTPSAFAEMIDELWFDRDSWQRKQENAWPSVKHLTIEEMAGNFVKGVSRALEGASKGLPDD